MKLPVVAIVGTFTHTLALLPAAFHVSTQNGIGVTPSLAVTRRSLPSLFALPNGNPLVNCTFTSKFAKLAPELFVKLTAFRYVHDELYHDAVPVPVCTARLALRVPLP